jgi:hypothetical protein
MVARNSEYPMEGVTLHDVGGSVPRCDGATVSIRGIAVVASFFAWRTLLEDSLKTDMALLIAYSRQPWLFLSLFSGRMKADHEEGWKKKRNQW